jgi:lipopolysaccharide transport system ATP-binding protein
MGWIRTRGLGKAYKRYARRRGRLVEWLGFGPQHETCWVLRDVDLEVAPGEALGIIGANGAGKSTLLKLITGVTQATTGELAVGGQIAALLELGLGFHGEFTGRHNASIAAQLAGHDPDTIAACLPEIAAFADIGDYLDQPVRTYSSGMQVRLAFAVATMVRPEILIVDEALAVGDVFFQQRCFERIRRFREQGTTLLFVSHAMQTVYTLCDRAILLDEGQVQIDGSPREVIDLYNAHTASRQGSGDLQVDSGERLSAGSYTRGDATIEAVEIIHRGQAVHTLPSDSELAVRINVLFHRAVDDPHVGLQIRDRRGEALYMTHTHGMGRVIGAVQAGERRTVCYRFRARLIPGDYTVTAGVADGGLPGGQLRHSLTRHQDAAQFTLTTNLNAVHWNGLVNLEPECVIE